MKDLKLAWYSIIKGFTLVFLVAGLIGGVQSLLNFGIAMVWVTFILSLMFIAKPTVMIQTISNTGTTTSYLLDTFTNLIVAVLLIWYSQYLSGSVWLLHMALMLLAKMEVDKISEEISL